MRIVVVGLGSMGRRRIRLLQGFFPGTELCGVDADEKRAAGAAIEWGIPCYTSLAQALAEFSPGLGFVCTSPLGHAEITAALLGAGLDVFSEINLVSDGYDETLALAADRQKLLFLSSTPMYRKETIYIEQLAAAQTKPLAYRYHVGQYLPDWHPWESYRDFFVADERTNGIRELLAIELPWLLRCFGGVVSFRSHSQTLSSLGLGYPDTLSLELRHAAGHTGQLLFDVVSRKAVRAFELVGEDAYLSWGGTPDSLTRYDIAQKVDESVELYADALHDERYAQNIVENAYVDEMAAFFETLAGREARRHTFEQDRALLALIDDIERKGAKGK